MVESGGVPRKGRILASIEKRSRRVPEKEGICVYRKMVKFGRVSGKGRIHASIKNWSRRIPEKVESVRVSKNCPGEYRKRVESVRILKNGRIEASTGKR